MNTNVVECPTTDFVALIRLFGGKGTHPVVVANERQAEELGYSANAYYRDEYGVQYAVRELAPPPTPIQTATYLIDDYALLTVLIIPKHEGPAVLIYHTT